MNHLGVYHGDLKASNVLINEDTSQIRIIDWGLSLIDKRSIFSTIPSDWKNRKLQYNNPFGIILLSVLYFLPIIMIFEATRF